MSREIWVEKEDNNHPIFWDKEVNGVLYGKRNKVHTVQIAVKVPKLKMDMSLSAINPDGKRQIIEGESHSWTRNFYNHISSGMGKDGNDATDFQDGNINGKDTDGVVISADLPFHVNNISGDAEDGGFFAENLDSSYGICVGTGTSVETIESFALATPVIHGVSADQLLYRTSPKFSYVWDSGTRVLSNKLTRFFDNFSAGSITLKEIGLIALFGAFHSGGCFLVSRDLITNLVVADKTMAVISYIFSLTFPSTGSPLRNFYNYLFSYSACVDCDGGSGSFGDGVVNIKDTSGNIKSGYFILRLDLSSLESASGFCGANNNNTYGAQVGTTATLVSFEDNAMAGLVEHGSGAGQMTYMSGDTPTRSWSDPVMTIQHARPINNGSGASITIKEVGLVARLEYSTLYPYTLMLRDVISDVVVEVGESIRPVHQFQVTYP